MKQILGAVSPPWQTLPRGGEGLKHMADEAKWFVACVERSLGQGFESPEVDPGEDGDYPFGDGGATAYVHGGESVLAAARTS